MNHFLFLDFCQKLGKNVSWNLESKSFMTVFFISLLFHLKTVSVIEKNENEGDDEDKSIPFPESALPYPFS